MPSQPGYLVPQRKEAKRLGRHALAAGIGSAATYWMLGGIPFLGPLIGLGGLGLTAYTTWKWFQYRAQWGMRF